MKFNADVQVRTELLPGDIGQIAEQHGVIYHNEQGWDHTFEAYVAGPLSEFAKSSSSRQRIWIATSDKKYIGSIAIAEASNTTAQLRWFLVVPSFRSQGLGSYFMEQAISFANASEYQTIFLWTTSELQVAARLYLSYGFKKTEKQTHNIWGKLVTEERYELIL